MLNVTLCPFPFLRIIVQDRPAEGTTAEVVDASLTVAHEADISTIEAPCVEQAQEASKCKDSADTVSD